MAGKAFLVLVLATLLAASALLISPVTGRTLGELVRADPQLSDIAYVLRTFNAVGELDDRGRTLTVFAPTNEAIRKLGRCFGVPPISIQVVLTVARRYATVDFHKEVERTALYHVTEGRRSWGDLLRTVGYPSLLVDHWMSTSANRAGLVGRTPNFPVATVLNREAPIQAENGLLYKVNLPLLPYDVPSGQIQC